jgi:hypothetical protein
MTSFLDPMFYVPFRHGRYDVAPGLTKFRRGDPGADGKVFQFDRTFGAFRKATGTARTEGMEKYYVTRDLKTNVFEEVCRFISERLRTEGRGDAVAKAEDVRAGPYIDALDALACQVQEDLAVVSSEGGRHWLSAAHVCFPNGWAPREKVGRSFAAIHEPVAGMGEMNRREGEFARLMVGAEEGLVRFAWGVTFDEELNHHPDRARTPFDPARPRAFVRVERQTIWGLPAAGAAMFTIRTYLYDVEQFRADPVLRGALGAALRSMTEESRRYKGLEEGFGELVGWVEGEGRG